MKILRMIGGLLAICGIFLFVGIGGGLEKDLCTEIDFLKNSAVCFAMIVVGTIIFNKGE